MPLDYVQYQAGVLRPLERAMQGYEFGTKIRAQQEQQSALDLQKAQAAQMQADLANLAANPRATAQDYAAMMVKYPTMSEHFKSAWDVLNSEQRNVKQSQALNLFSALDAGQVDVAERLLEEQKAAAENSNLPQDAAAADAMLQLVRTKPEAARTSAGLLLSSTMGVEKFAETWTKLQSERRERERAPYELTEAQSKARKAATEAKFAESQAVLELQKKGWDITKISEDLAIAKENNKIALLNAQLQRETNELKRQELQGKLADAQREREQTVRDRASELETAYTGIDNSLSVIDRLIANPELDNILGAVEGSSFYPSTLVGLISPFSDADKRADAQADLENIQSQSFLNNLMEAKAKGATFGSLTEKEGERLVGYVRNLKTKQSEPQFRSNLAEIQRLLKKSRDNLATKYNVQKETSGSDSVTVGSKTYTRPATFTDEQWTNYKAAMGVK